MTTYNSHGLAASQPHIDDGLNTLTIKMHFTTLGNSPASSSVSCFSCFLVLLTRIA